MVKSKISGEIEKGDLIIITSSWSYLGFYLGRGQGGSVQFYDFRNIIYWDKALKGKTKFPYKSYIYRYPENRVAKYDEHFIADGELKEKYYKCVEILKSLKII